MQCKKEGCEGKLKDGICQLCGASASAAEEGEDYPGYPGYPGSVTRQTVTANMKQIMESQTPACKADLLEAAQKFESMVPDDFASWRMQANLLLTAIKQLELRQMEPDETTNLMGIPLTESNLRHACEKALRNCAHFAQNFEDRVALIDEANSVRQTTWF